MKNFDSYILIVEDHLKTALVFKKICMQLFPNCDIELAHTYSDGCAALAMRQQELFLAIVDIGLPDGVGTAIIEKISRQHSKTISIVTTIFDDDEHLLEALRAGARGYLLKGHSPEELSRYLHEALYGMPALSPSVAMSVLSYVRMSQPRISTKKFATLPELGSLTTRETEILNIVSRGYSTKETGKLLGISNNTICVHIKNIYRKLNINNRAEAVLAAQYLPCAKDPL